MKKALITGITGQDGSYLSELLLLKEYQVNGIVRRSSTFNTERLDHINDNNLILHHGDMTDSSCIRRILDKVQPDEVYNLGALSHVGASFELPIYAGQVDALATLTLLDAIKEVNTKIKFYQASTSELFGGLDGTQPQNENTPFYPKSPYACAKLYSYWATINYKESYGIHANNGILFNHESPRRLPNFVTRKITYGMAQILSNKQDVIELGNLDAKRDWGFAGDYVEAMWLMLQQENPHNLVIATGVSKSIRDFAEEAFKHININLQWKGKNENEVGYDPKTNKIWIKVNPKYYRPSEVEILQGDASKAKKELGWIPKTSFEQLVKMMVEHDINNIK